MNKKKLAQQCGDVCGIINKFEILRYINASISLYVVTFYYIFNVLKKINIFRFFSIIIIFLYFIIIGMRIPKSSNFFDVYIGDKSNYLNINLKYFGSKKFTKDYIIYFEDIKKNICDKKKVYNFSFDRSLNYLCLNKSNEFSIFENYENVKSSILNNSLIISHYEINDLKQLKKIKIPKFYRYTNSDTFFKFYPDYIILYEKN